MPTDQIKLNRRKIDCFLITYIYIYIKITVYEFKTKMYLDNSTITSSSDESCLYSS